MKPEVVAEILQPFLQPGEHLAAPLVPPSLYDQLALYLELLLRWNARTNLTAIRDPTLIVQRHFGESLFAARCLAAYLSPAATLLDFGSGAGFPGLPTQLLRPDLLVTLAESQGKKAAFLREAVRTLNVATEVWSGRVEEMPPARQFDGVTLRAVDSMEAARKAAAARLARGGVLLEFAGRILAADARQLLESVPVPLSESNSVNLYRL